MYIKSLILYQCSVNVTFCVGPVVKCSIQSNLFLMFWPYQHDWDWMSVSDMTFILLKLYFMPRHL